MLAVSVDQGSVLFADHLIWFGHYQGHYRQYMENAFALNMHNNTLNENNRKNFTEVLAKQIEDHEKTMKTMLEEFQKNMTALLSKFNATLTKKHG